MSNFKNSEKYMQRGVSASKEDVHNAIKNLDKGHLSFGETRISDNFIKQNLDII